MHNAMKDGSANEKVHLILEKLASYTMEHFRDEEHLMVKYGYPNFSDHQNKHLKMQQKVKSLLLESNSGKQLLTFKVSKFLVDWLNKHILRTDMKYKEFLNRRPKSTTQKHPLAIY
jgi:hemerythrin